MCYIVGIVVRPPSKRSLELSKVVKQLGELDREAEKRYEESEFKRFRAFQDAEERREKSLLDAQERFRAEERKHEERMQRMFMTFMQQMVSGRPQYQMYTGPAGSYFPGQSEAEDWSYSSP